MLISGGVTATQPPSGSLSYPQSYQAQSYQAEFRFSQSSLLLGANSEGQNIGLYSSAVTVSLSIRSINVTTGFLAAEQTIEDTEPDAIESDHNHNRAKGIEKALKNLFQELEENDGLTGKVAKRLFKLVSTLNSARGTDTKLGKLDKETREEVRSARDRVNEFFRTQHSTVLVDQNLINFIELVSKLETLREFTLRTTDLLSALKENAPDIDETNPEEEEQPPLIDIEA